MEKEKDFSCADLAVFLSNCKAHYKLSDIIEKLYPQKKGRWWLDKSNHIHGGQRVHLIAYLGYRQCLGTKNSDSVKFVWSPKGFKNAAGIMWLLEALGADEKHLEIAFNVGIKAGKGGKNQSLIALEIKKSITWEYITKLLNAKGIKEKR